MRPAVLALLLAAGPAHALGPADVVVVFNTKVPASREVADHYLAKRNVPKDNLVGLDLPADENISRADYDSKLAGPLREALKGRKDKVKVLLTVYGVPLRVGRKLPAEADKPEIDKLFKDMEAAKKAGNQKEADRLYARYGPLSGNESEAAVDSELMLLWWPPYEPFRWVINPLYFRLPDAAKAKSPPVLLTARLDAQTPEIAKRLVDDAVAVEAEGLKGKAYVDARGIKYDARTHAGSASYDGYDESFREAAGVLKDAGLDVTLDDKPELFAPGSCPDAAIYTGWYQLSKYVPSNKFVRGAVAWHLASGEAATLRAADATVWCPNLLKDGAAVTLGPVNEPYTVGFPKPAEFFAHLLTGKYTVVECYARTMMLTSWMTVLVGDPLYNPFGKTPKLKEEDILPSPKGSPLPFK
jgi:uncharacterized protein (TIGR03790 family)